MSPTEQAVKLFGFNFEKMRGQGGGLQNLTVRLSARNLQNIIGRATNETLEQLAISFPVIFGSRPRTFRFLLAMRDSIRSRANGNK